MYIKYMFFNIIAIFLSIVCFSYLLCVLMYLLCFGLEELIDYYEEKYYRYFTPTMTTSGASLATADELGPMHAGFTTISTKCNRFFADALAILFESGNFLVPGVFYVFFFLQLLLALVCLFYKDFLSSIGFTTAVFGIYNLCLHTFIITFVLFWIREFALYIDFGSLFYIMNFLNISLLFVFDLASLLCSILVVWLLIFIIFFTYEYMFRELFLTRILYLLFMFAVSVIFFFFVYDILLFLIFWDLIGIYSYLLVNFYFIRNFSFKAAIKTFIYSRFSDGFLFLVFILLLAVFETSCCDLIFVQVPYFFFYRIVLLSLTIHYLSIVAVLISLAALIKSAQFIFYVWLPDAMEAPTPASALIHSSTLVVIGIYIILRFSILFEFVQAQVYLLGVFGCLSIFLGSFCACFQFDLKKLIAYSTISQVGYLICGCAFCAYDCTFFYLIVHALNKAFLFIIAGYFIHYSCSNTDLRQMGGYFYYSFDFAVYLIIICFNLIGLPYSSGFFVKDFFIFQLGSYDNFTLFVKTCWLSSLIFSPFYFFCLIFFICFSVCRCNSAVYHTYDFSYDLLRMLKFTYVVKYFLEPKLTYDFCHWNVSKLCVPTKFDCITKRRHFLEWVFIDLRSYFFGHKIGVRYTYENTCADNYMFNWFFNIFAIHYSNTLIAGESTTWFYLYFFFLANSILLTSCSRAVLECGLEHSFQIFTTHMFIYMNNSAGFFGIGFFYYYIFFFVVITLLLSFLYFLFFYNNCSLFFICNDFIYYITFYFIYVLFIIFLFILF